MIFKDHHGIPWHCGHIQCIQGIIFGKFTPNIDFLLNKGHEIAKKKHCGTARIQCMDVQSQVQAYLLICFILHRDQTDISLAPSSCGPMGSLKAPSCCSSRSWPKITTHTDVPFCRHQPAGCSWLFSPPFRCIGLFKRKIYREPPKKTRGWYPVHYMFH